MGMFGGKKKVFVSSSVWNLAGDAEKRPNYLKTATFSAILSEDDFAGSLTKAYLEGPGIRLRNFYPWAVKSGFLGYLGQITSTSTRQGEISASNIDDVEDAILATYSEPDTKVMVTSAITDKGDYTWFAAKYLALPPYEEEDMLMSGWQAEWISIWSAHWEARDFIEVSWENGEFARMQLFPTNPMYDVDSDYVYAIYNEILEGEESDKILESRVDVPSDVEFPTVESIASSQSNIYDLDVVFEEPVDSRTDKEYYLYRKKKSVKTYSDGQPEEIIEDSTNYVHEIGKDGSIAYTSEKFYVGTLGNAEDEDAIRQRILYYSQFQTSKTTEYTYTHIYEEDVENEAGETIRVTITTTEWNEHLYYEKYYTIEYKDIIAKKWSNPRIFIYKRFEGNPVLDSLFEDKSQANMKYYPIIPIRIDNQFVGDDYLPAIYGINKKALRKSIKARYDDLVGSIKESPSVGDMDYIYAVFGCSFNSKDRAAKEYIYSFFNHFAIESLGEDEYGKYELWQGNLQDAQEKNTEWGKWKLAQSDHSNPLYGTPEPVKVSIPSYGKKNITISTANNHIINYNMTISWIYIYKINVSGIYGNLKVGDIAFIDAGEVFQAPRLELYINGFLGSVGSPDRIRETRIIKQDSENGYSMIVLGGLTHTNSVYKGKTVVITAGEALADDEESGFLIPLEQTLLKEISLVDKTQLATSCAYLVINCYEEKKVKWYQRGFFKVFLVVVAIAITVYSGGAGAGLLGANASVGASLGFTGVAAAIVGGVANAVAAMFIVKIISAGATALLGDKLGAIIGTIAGAIAVSVGSGMLNGQSFSTAFSNLSAAPNLMKLSVSGLDSVSQYMGMEAQEYFGKTQELMTNYQTEMQKINQAYETMFGNSGLGISPTDFSRITGGVYDSPDFFLSRTLLTGPDIAEASLSMLSNFAQMSLSLEPVR